MKSHIDSLKAKHIQLDQTIKSVNNNHKVIELKKQKLMLKEKITLLEEQNL